ncbi:MAG: hypothetical protein WD048_05510 [Chitinophagales bacterium]
MYSKRKGLILGFHGCDKSLRDKIVSRKGIILKSSDNTYDWLGSGAYFWENNYKRALDFANYLHKNPPHNKKQKIKNPAVLGAVIDIGYCLDLLDSQYLDVLKIGYNMLLTSKKKFGLEIPKNIPLKENKDLLKRNLDCAVIETIHQFNKDTEKKPFDSVRGVFFEGEDLYPNAGFKERNHIQIAIRNPNCIKGYFIPRELNTKYPKT